MSTEIVPVAPEPAPAADPTAETPVEPAPRKRRRGWIVAVVIVGVLVVLGIVGFFVGEAFAQQYARDYVRERIVEVLKLPADADVDVELGGGSIILQAISGRVDTVDVEVPDAAFGELQGALSFHAEGVPLEATESVDVLRIDFRVGADDLAVLNGGDGSATAPTFEIGEEDVALSSQFELFGAVIPLGFTFEPSADEGDLVLTPTSLTIGEAVFEAGSEDDSFLGQLASAFLQPMSLCIAGSVPQALTLDDARIDTGELVLTFDGDGASLGGPELSTPGTCPAA